jgi:hypothetical protein
MQRRSLSAPTGEHMHTQQPNNEPAKARPLTDEADIGSGEKTPGQLETE